MDLDELSRQLKERYEEYLLFAVSEKEVYIGQNMSEENALYLIARLIEDHGLNPDAVSYAVKKLREPTTDYPI